MLTCPLTEKCSCRITSAGGVVLAVCGYLLCSRPVPTNDPVMMAVVAPLWSFAVIMGFVWLMLGLRATIREREIPSGSFWAVATIVAFNFFNDQYFVKEYPVLEYIYVGIIGAGLPNTAMSFWMSGYVVGIERMPKEWERQLAARDAQIAKLAKQTHPLDTVLTIPGMAKALLRTAHSISHPDRAKTEPEKRVLTERFKRVTAAFDAIKEKSQ